MKHCVLKDEVVHGEGASHFEDSQWYIFLMNCEDNDIDTSEIPQLLFGEDFDEYVKVSYVSVDEEVTVSADLEVDHVSVDEEVTVSADLEVGHVSVEDEVAISALRRR